MSKLSGSMIHGYLYVLFLIIAVSAFTLPSVNTNRLGSLGDTFEKLVEKRIRPCNEKCSVSKLLCLGINDNNRIQHYILCWQAFQICQINCKLRFNDLALIRKLAGGKHNLQ